LVSPFDCGIRRRRVKDVLVFDPATLLVLHARKTGTTRATSPQTIALECGCSVIV
jgi:hypothetical protein